MDEAELFAALKDPAEDFPCRHVQLDTWDGRELLLYGPAGDDQHADGGTLFIPREVLLAAEAAGTDV
jgi:hypothetical protein